MFVILVICLHLGDIIIFSNIKTKTRHEND
jgi:hypothetical protein